MKTRSIVTAFFVLALALIIAAMGSRADAAAVPPEYEAGNPTCEDLGYAYGVKFDEKDEDWYTLPDINSGTLGLGTVTWSTDGTYVDWSSTYGVDAVIVKGGPNANVYRYPPAESYGDTGLVSPTNSSNGQPSGLSHVEFCYDYELEVSKTAVTKFTRTYDWSISKSANTAEITLAPGQESLVQYNIFAGATYTDSDFFVGGKITIHNPDPTYPAIITEVIDKRHLQGETPIDIVVECGVTFPYTLPAGETLTCTYGDVPVPDNRGWVNKAAANVDKDSKVGRGDGTANLIFETPTTEVDECIDIYDSNLPSDDDPQVMEPIPVCYPGALSIYTKNVGPYEECGEYEYVNTAYFITNDTPTQSDPVSWTILVHVPCAGGCTLTPGYWKTHSEYGPAPYDDNWASLPDGADTPFFHSGKSYYEVLGTPPSGGNAYYILAHAYIAAELNRYNGAASTPEVDAAMTWAEAFFNTYTPSSTYSRQVRNEAIRKAELLDQYNNGYIGPGHCSEPSPEDMQMMTTMGLDVGEVIVLDNLIFIPLTILN